MSTVFPNELKTGFCETQRTIAIKYVEHINTMIDSASIEIINYIGYRDGKNYQGLDGGTIIDEYPYEHIGKTLAMEFEFFSENVRVEFINDVNYYVVYIHCQSDNNCVSDFMFEFEKKDKDLMLILSDKLINSLKE